MKNNNMDKILKDLSSQLGVSKDKIESAAKRGNIDDILQNADSQSSEKIKSVLNNPEKMQQIMNSPQAQTLKKLLDGE